MNTPESLHPRQTPNSVGDQMSHCSRSNIFPIADARGKRIIRMMCRKMNSSATTAASLVVTWQWWRPRQECVCVLSSCHFHKGLSRLWSTRRRQKIPICRSHESHKLGFQFGSQGHVSCGSGHRCIGSCSLPRHLRLSYRLMGIRRRLQVHAAMSVASWTVPRLA